MQTDEGPELQVTQVVSIQSQNGQTVERSQSFSVHVRDVVVAQLENLHRQTRGWMDGWTVRLRVKVNRV